GNPVEPAHFGAEVEAREHPQARKRLADVVGVAVVEVGLRDARLGERADQAGDERAELDRREAAVLRGLRIATDGRRAVGALLGGLCALRSHPSPVSLPGVRELTPARLSGARSRAD